MARPFRKIDQLIYDCCVNRGHQDLPVILLLGAPGSGKTTILRDNQQRCSGVRPCTLQNLEDRSVRPYMVVARLARDLRRRVKRFDRIQFPRFLLGVVVVQSDIDPLSQSWERADLKNLFGDKRALRSRIDDITNSLLNEVRHPPGTKTAVRLAVDMIMAAAKAVQILHGRGYRWYRQALGQTFQDPLDALVELKRMDESGDPTARSQVEEILCRAFLADLRDGFSRKRRAVSDIGNCLVLIDNADSPTGQEFLKILLRARQAEVDDRTHCDPLVVVAAGRTRFSVFELGPDRLPAIRRPDDAGYADWADNRGHNWAALRERDLRDWLYPVELEAPEPRDPSYPPDWETGELAQRLTLGHPWGLEIVGQALQRVGYTHEGRSSLLDWKDPEHQSRTLGEVAIRRMLPGVPDMLRDQLTTCAATLDLSETSRERALDRMQPLLGDLDWFCSTSIWVRPAHHGPVLHPFLRRILLHALARRGENDDDWLSVHTRLRSHYEKRDPNLEAYHALALGDFGAAVLHLGDRFANSTMRSWLKDLYCIASAPRLARSAAEEPDQQVRELVPREGHVLAQLVAALWIAADPLGDPTGALDTTIAADFELLATKTEHERDVLRREARRYRIRGGEER